MNDPGYEPLLDSKWAIPFVALLFLFAFMVLMLVKGALKLSRKYVARRLPRQVAARSILTEAKPLTASLQTKQL